MSTPRERTVRLDGIPIHIRDVGDGPPVLLINGLGAHTEMWGAVEGALRGFRLISFDAPGAGRSATPLWPVPVPKLARLATLVLDTVGVERADVVGYSMGGLIAQQLAADHPDRVRRVVLAATTCGLGAVPGTPGSMLQMAVPARFLSPRMYKSTIGSIAGGRARHDEEWVEKLAATRLRHTSFRGYMSQVISLSRWTGLPLLHKIPHPTLVVTGDDDPLAPVANAMLLVRLLPQARMLLAPGESHLLLVDCDSPVLEPIREFLAAEPLHHSPVWRDAVLVTDDELRAAIPPATRQAQPWGAVGALLRRRWLRLHTASTSTGAF